jgi:hypothetical protein
MTAFILRCHGYRTVPFGLEAENADCALIVWKRDDSASPSVQMKQLRLHNPSLPVLIVVEGSCPRELRGDLCLENPRMIDLLARLQLVIQRRRGPKPPRRQEEAPAERQTAA